MPFAHCAKTDEVYLLQVRITITLLVEFFFDSLHASLCF